MASVPRKIKTSWILEYSEAMLKISEAPAAYNVWSAISVISAVLKMKVWIKRGTYKIYPNQYIVLVGPPGVGKGTAIHPAHSFVKEHKPPLANYISDRVTAPKIIEKLSQGFSTTTIHNGLPVGGTESSAVLMSTELPTLLGSSDWMLPFLCDAWDRGTFEYDTRNKGTFIIKDMCVSLMGACVPEFIRRLNKDAASAINGGFTARTIFVFASDKSQSLVWPKSFDEHPATKQIQQDLIHDIGLIANLSGTFTFDPQAIIAFERFYHSVKNEDDDSEVVRHFKARQNVHVIKLAMCFSAATDDSMCITESNMKTSIALIQQVLNTLDITFRGVGESPLAEATAKIQAYIEKRGMCTRAQLLKDNHRHVTSEDLDRILTMLFSIEFYTYQRLHNKDYLVLKPKGKKSNVAGSANQYIPNP